jgi:NADH-quinone oxidoreductase subunit C
MQLSPETILQKLIERFADKITRHGVAAVIDRGHVVPILGFLKEDPETDFNILSDVTVVDHGQLDLPEIGERFAVVYQLYSLAKNHRFQVKARVSEDDPTAPSVCDLWRSALWGEREAHDMYGVEFDGNPDLRRLLMPEDFPGFPLRKDYPLHGRGERDAFPQYRPRTGTGGSVPAPSAGHTPSAGRTGGKP